MPIEKLKTDLLITGLPVTYRAWPEKKAPVPPFICYLCEDDNPLFADGSMYFSSSNVRVELYTAFKDPALEQKVEAALHDYHWKKSETYISTERCYMILYEIEV